MLSTAMAIPHPATTEPPLMRELEGLDQSCQLMILDRFCNGAAQQQQQQQQQSPMWPQQQQQQQQQQHFASEEDVAGLRIQKLETANHHSSTPASKANSNNMSASAGAHVVNGDAEGLEWIRHTCQQSVNFLF